MKTKRLLFVDDDEVILSSLKELFEVMSGDTWEIVTAQNHAQALEALQKDRMDLIVLDISMPIMDGFQFLQLINRTNPGQQVVMLTGRASEQTRTACLENGVLLLLEKPVSNDGFKAVYAALNALVDTKPQSGFRGMMRQVCLPEVLQMECLGRKSSILEIFTEKARGLIYISDGSIIHAESSTLQGEAALYGLLALRGGEFNLRPFQEPPRRTIEGSWEFLLMEAARLTDEGTQFITAESVAGSASPASDSPNAVIPEASQGKPSDSQSVDQPAETAVAFSRFAPEAVPELAKIQIKEIALCLGSGEVLFESPAGARQGRARLLEQIEQQGAQVSNVVAVGRFERLEILTEKDRVVCQIQTDRRLFVRSTTVSGGQA